MGDQAALGPRHKTIEELSPVGRLTGLGGELLGRRFIVAATTTIGRGNANDVTLTDPESSRSHARISLRGALGFEVEDLGSRNGTMVNGVRIQRPSPLRFGDRLRVGNTTFLFSRHDELGEELFQRNRLETVGRLSLALAHDLNNALCVVQSTTSLLLGPGEFAEAERAECLRDMLDASMRAGQLAKRLMSFARGHDERAGEIDLSQTVVEALRLLRRTLPADIALIEEVAPSLNVFAEPAQLQQIVFNLVINARDAIVARGGPGRIAVRATHAADEVLLSVEDDGCGISEGLRQRIFEPFFSSKDKGKGYGIGLSTVAEIVINHGGTIDVQSVVGRGSTFTVRLRGIHVGMQRHSTQQRVPTPPPESLRANGNRVLVVDADRGVRNAIKRALHHAGFDVVAAPSCAAGMTQKPPFELVIVDLGDDPKGVAELLDHLRTLEPRLRVLCLAATGGEAEIAASRAASANGLVVKPFTREELVGAAVRVLRRMKNDDTTVAFKVDG